MVATEIIIWAVYAFFLPVAVGWLHHAGSVAAVPHLTSSNNCKLCELLNAGIALCIVKSLYRGHHWGVKFWPIYLKVLINCEY